MESTPSPAEVRAELEAITGSEGFQGAPKLRRFLRYIVEQQLQGEGGAIKESVIGCEVYHKNPQSYDPRLDATVRVEASKLRQRLAHYYDTDPGSPSVRISVPKGSYVPRFERVGATAPAPASPARLRRFARPALVAAALTATTAALVWFTAGNSGRPVEPLRFTQLTGFDTFATEPALSAAGDFAVYVSDRDTPGIMNIWRQSVETGSAARLTTLDGSAHTPTISASGERIVFRWEGRGGLLATVPMATASAQVSPLGSAARGRNPRFAPSGERLVYWVPQDEQTLDRGAVFLLDLADLTQDPSRLFAEFAHASYPVWSAPGGHVIALGTWQSNSPAREYDAWVSEAPRGAAQKTGLLPLLLASRMYQSIAERSRIRVEAWRAGWLYFSAPNGAGENLYRIRLDERTLRVSGEPEAVTAGTGSLAGARFGARGRRMVFASTLTGYQLASIAVRPASEDAPRRHSGRVGMSLRPSVDRAGRMAAWEMRRSGGATAGLWVENLVTGQGREIAREGAFVLVSPDGRTAAYQTMDGKKQAIFLQDLASGAPEAPKRICDDCGAPSDWSQAGTHVVYVTGGRPAGIGVLDTRSGKSRTLLDHPSHGLLGARYAVDEQGNGWMAMYADTGPRTRQIFLAPVRAHEPAPWEQWIAATDGAHWDLSPAWAPDGHSLYFVSTRDGQRCIWNQELDPVTRRPRGSPRAVYHFHSPAETLMQSVPYRGAEQLWAAGGRLFFSMDKSMSSVWIAE